MDEHKTFILKKILYSGRKQATFKNGTKVTFHFQTRLCDQQKTLIDDSKIGLGKPMELILGKKFKMEVWETIIQKMAIDEISQFTIDKSLVLQYPFISKTFREAHIPPHERNDHHCAMTLQQQGIGYADLNNLLKNPQDLTFTIELLNVEQPEDYEKEVWQMDDEEQLNQVQVLKEKGNKIFKEKNYKAASSQYAEAIGILERLMLKEKPHSEEWESLNKLKIPLLLNFAQCKLNEDDFYAAIEHCTTVLQSQPNNVKALFRRGKAHIGAWNPIKAKQDFEAVAQLDKSLMSIVKKELETLEKLIKLKNQTDREKYQSLFSN